MKIGYCRVSTLDQSLDRQTDNIKAAGAERIFEEKISGVKAHRPELDRMLNTLRAGDTLIVDSFSRLSRSTKDLLDMVERITDMGVSIISLKEKLDTTTATGKMMLTMLSALSQFERDIISERTVDGLKAARARGRKGGRPKAADDKTIRAALALYDSNRMTNREIAQQFNVSTSTFSRWIKARADKRKASEN